MLQHKHHRFVDKLGSTWFPHSEKAYGFGLVGRTVACLLPCSMLDIDADFVGVWYMRDERIESDRVSERMSE